MKTNQMHITLNIGKDCNAVSHRFEFSCSSVTTLQLPLFEQKVIFKDVIPDKKSTGNKTNEMSFFERLAQLKDMVSLELTGNNTQDKCNLRVKPENIQFLSVKMPKKEASWVEKLLGRWSED